MTGRRPRRPAPFGTLLRASVRRDFAGARSYRLPFVLELTTALFALSVFFFLSKLVDRGRVEPVLEQPRGYFAFAAIGLVLIRLAQSGFSSMSTKLRAEQNTGTLEALLTSPAPAWQVILAGAGYAIVYAAVASVALVGLAAIVFGLRVSGDPAALAVAAAGFGATITFVIGIGLVLAAFTLVFKQSSAVVSLGVAALTLLGGVYFPVTVLPSPLEALGRVIPFTWGLRVLRGALLAGDKEIGLLVALVVADVFALLVGIWTLEAAVRRVRRTGTLSQY